MINSASYVCSGDNDLKYIVMFIDDYVSSFFFCASVLSKKLSRKFKDNFGITD